MLVRNKWNRKSYVKVAETDSSVTLEREDKSQFTINKKEFYFNYFEIKA